MLCLGREREERRKQAGLVDEEAQEEQVDADLGYCCLRPCSLNRHACSAPNGKVMGTQSALAGPWQTLVDLTSFS